MLINSFKVFPLLMNLFLLIKGGSMPPSYLVKANSEEYSYTLPFTDLPVDSFINNNLYEEKIINLNEISWKVSLGVATSTTSLTLGADLSHQDLLTFSTGYGNLLSLVDCSVDEKYLLAITSQNPLPSLNTINLYSSINNYKIKTYLFLSPNKERYRQLSLIEGIQGDYLLSETNLSYVFDHQNPGYYGLLFVSESPFLLSNTILSFKSLTLLSPYEEALSFVNMLNEGVGKDAEGHCFEVTSQLNTTFSRLSSEARNMFLTFEDENFNLARVRFTYLNNFTQIQEKPLENKLTLNLNSFLDYCLILGLFICISLGFFFYLKFKLPN